MFYVFGVSLGFLVKMFVPLQVLPSVLAVE